MDFNTLYEYIFPKNNNEDGFLNRYVKEHNISNELKIELLFFCEGLLKDIRDKK